MPPTANPERISTGIFFDWMSNASRWSADSIKPFGTAELEEDALLMGILVEGKGGEVTPSHLLLGIWSEKESTGHMILASLGFNSDKGSEQDKSVSVETGFFTGRTYNVFTFRPIRILP